MTQILIELSLAVSFAVCFAFSRTLADNRLPAGKLRTRRQREALAWLVLSNCATAAPGGALCLLLGEIWQLNLFSRLCLAAAIGWYGLDWIMKKIEDYFPFLRRSTPDGSCNPQGPGLAGDQLGSDGAGRVPADQ